MLSGGEMKSEELLGGQEIEPRPATSRWSPVDTNVS